MEISPKASRGKFWNWTQALQSIKKNPLTFSLIFVDLSQFQDPEDG